MNKVALFFVIACIARLSFADESVTPAAVPAPIEAPKESATAENLVPEVTSASSVIESEVTTASVEEKPEVEASTPEPVESAEEEVEEEEVSNPATDDFNSTGMTYTREYAKIDRYLSEQCEYDDFEGNILYAQEYLEELERDQNTPRKEYLVHALKQLLALENVVEDRSCRKENYDILESNKRAVDVEDGERRIDYVVAQAVEMWNKNCPAVM